MANAIGEFTGGANTGISSATGEVIIQTYSDKAIKFLRNVSGTIAGFQVGAGGPLPLVSGASSGSDLGSASFGYRNIFLSDGTNSSVITQDTTLQISYPTGQSLVIKEASTDRWSFATSGHFTQDATNGGDIVFNKATGLIRQGTADAADTKRLDITAGGAAAAGRSGVASFFGNDFSDSRKGCVSFQTGDAAGANVFIGLNNSTGFLAVNDSNPAQVWRVGFSGKMTLSATNTAAATVGDQVINKPTGTVNFAAAAATLTVTNNLVTTASIVFAVVRTDDLTATIKSVVPAAGSFLITLGAAATAETSVGFIVYN